MKIKRQNAAFYRDRESKKKDITNQCVCTTVWKKIKWNKCRYLISSISKKKLKSRKKRNNDGGTNTVFW